MPRTPLRLLLTALLLAPLAACGGSGGDGGTTGNGSGGGTKNAASYRPPALDWKTCTPKHPGSGSSPRLRWQCAKLKVPLDYAKPDGDTIDLALIRTRATTQDKSKRIGSLVFNFGGPGGSGVDTLPGFAPQYDALRRRYDLVSFDPRGVGASEGVHCLGNKELDAYFAADNTPDTAAEEKSFLARTRKFNDGCEDRSGKVLPYVGTRNAARDMDTMRKALGDDKLHYMGVSYGTELGGVYAHLFPKRVGRAVLDSAVDPTEDATASSLSQTKGFELALDQFVKDCVSLGEECPLGEDPDEAERQIADLLERLDGNPIPGSGGRALTESLATSGIAQALYSQDLWPVLREGLDDAKDDDGRTLLALADALNGRNEDGTYSTLQPSFVAINCADDKARPSAGDVEDEMPEFRKASPVFGRFMGWALLSCTDWAVAGYADKPDVSAKGAPPIVVIGTTNDPATPFEGSKRMAEALGKGVGVQLTHKGQGHGAYDASGCVRTVVDAYLLHGTVPKPGRTCS